MIAYVRVHCKMVLVAHSKYAPRCLQWCRETCTSYYQPYAPFWRHNDDDPIRWGNFYKKSDPNQAIRLGSRIQQFFWVPPCAMPVVSCNTLTLFWKIDIRKVKVKEWKNLANSLRLLATRILNHEAYGPNIKQKISEFSVLTAAVQY